MMRLRRDQGKGRQTVDKPQGQDTGNESKEH